MARKNAEFTAPHTVYSDYFEILLIVDNYECTLQVQIVDPNILKSTAVNATVALDTELAKHNHNRTFRISDGISFIGFITCDAYTRVSFTFIMYLL